MRGFGSPFTQQAWGADLSAADYLARANGAVLVLVQIETRGGVENLDDILGVEGLGESSNYWMLVRDLEALTSGMCMGECVVQMACS